MKIKNNDTIKQRCRNKIKCLTGVKKNCKCLLVGEMKNKKTINLMDIAKKLEELQSGIKLLKEKGLNGRAIMVLLQDSTKMTRRDISKMLEAIENLETIYCEQPKKKEKL